MALCSVFKVLKRSHGGFNGHVSISLFVYKEPTWNFLYGFHGIINNQRQIFPNFYHRNQFFKLTKIPKTMEIL